MRGSFSPSPVGAPRPSANGGLSWTAQNNQPTAQFYHVAVDNRFPYWIYGAQQDNSTVRIASRADSYGIGAPDWHDVGGGESGFVVPRPDNSDIVYAGSYTGSRLFPVRPSRKRNPRMNSAGCSVERMAGACRRKRG